MAGCIAYRFSHKGQIRGTGRQPTKDTMRAYDRSLSTLLSGLHGHLHEYLISRFRSPKDTDDLAHEVYLQLQNIDDEKLSADPLAALCEMAAGIVSQSKLADERPAGQEFDLQAHIDEGLSKLPPLEAALLLASKRDRLSIENIAARFQLPLDVVHTTIAKARAHIRMRYGDLSPGDSSRGVPKCLDR